MVLPISAAVVEKEAPPGRVDRIRHLTVAMVQSDESLLCVAISIRHQVSISPLTAFTNDVAGTSVTCAPKRYGQRLQLSSQAPSLAARDSAYARRCACRSVGNRNRLTRSHHQGFAVDPRKLTLAREL